MSDDLSRLDATIDAQFRTVGWQAAGHRDRPPDHGEIRGDERTDGGVRPAAPDEQADIRELAAGLRAAVEQFAPRLGRIEAQIDAGTHAPPSALQSIDDRLGVVAEVLNRRSPMDAGSENGVDPQATLRSELAALRTEVTVVKARLESLTTVLVEFGNVTRRNMASVSTEILIELGKLSDQVSRLARSNRPRPEISRNQPIVRER